MISVYRLHRTPLEKALPRFLERAYSRGFPLVVVCPDAARLQALDQVLWTFSPQAFVPHGLWSGTEDETTHALTPIWLVREDVLQQRPNLWAQHHHVLICGASLPPQTEVPCYLFFDGHLEADVAWIGTLLHLLKTRPIPPTLWSQNTEGKWVQVTHFSEEGRAP